VARAAVVHAALGEGARDLQRALRRQVAQRRLDEQALLAARLGREPGRALGEQVHDDRRAVVVVDPRGERARVEAAVVAEDVAVEEVERDGLLPGRAVELGLPGAREARVDERDEVFALDALDGQATLGGGARHGRRSIARDAVRGVVARSSSSVSKTGFRKSRRVPRTAPET
jgi:hypothetical protein